MRTTLDIDDDVLQAAKELAGREKTTAGAVISALARKGLAAPKGPPTTNEPESFYGFQPLPKRGVVVTNDLINKLREDDIY